jgi:hypothetical protein
MNNLEGVSIGNSTPVGPVGDLPLPSTWLWERNTNVNSQCGEDGVIAAILDLLPETNRWCVEFGASDGRTGSISCTLIENRGYSAVLIEGNPSSFRQLQSLHGGNERVFAFNEYIGLDPSNSIETVLARTPIPFDFDVISIDIDSCDYHVWESMRIYRPRIVCIEFNPSIPTGVRFVQAPDFNLNQGNSLSSLVDLGRLLGYELVCVTPVNAIFVEKSFFPLCRIQDNRPESLRLHHHYITWLFTGYDGKVLTLGDQTLPWHGIAIHAPQPLPRFLQKYPPRYSFIERVLFRVLRRPETVLPNFKRRVARWMAK